MNFVKIFGHGSIGPHWEQKGLVVEIVGQAQLGHGEEKQRGVSHSWGGLKWLP
jgi:hypothetical protein